MTTKELIIKFFEVYSAAPIIVLSYAGYRLLFKTKFVNISEISARG